MAKVPYKSTPSETLQDTPIPAMHPSGVSAEGFGANIGRAVEGLGKSISGAGDMFAQHALKEQGLENEAAAKDLLLWADVEMGKKTVEYNSLEGKDKYEGYGGYVKEIEGIRQQGIQQAGSNPAVRRLFDNAITGRVATAITSGAGQAATAKKMWQTQTSAARVDNAISDTAANWQNEPRFQQNIGIVNQEIDYQGKMHSWSPEVIQKERLEATSKVWGARIQSMARSDPFAARSMFDKNKDQISGLQQIAIDKYLGEQDVNVGTRIISDSVINGDPEPPKMSIPAPPKPQSSLSGGIDRTAFQQELTPSVVSKMARMVKGEVGLGQDPVKEKIQLESVFNRSQIRGHSLSEGLLSVSESKRGYYASTTYNRAVSERELEYFKKEILEPVLAGSDEGTKFLGSPVTGNASLMSFAGARLAQGKYAAGKWYSGKPGVDEMFVTEKMDAARLANSPLQRYGEGPVAEAGQPYQVAMAGDEIPVPAPAQPAFPGTPPVQDMDTGKQVVQRDPLTPDSGPEWLERNLQKARDWARKIAPDNPRFEDQLLIRVETEYNRVKRVKTQADRENYFTVYSAVMGDFGDRMMKSPDQLFTDPVLNDRFTKLDPAKQQTVLNQIKKNATADVPLTPERYGRFQELMGLSVTDPQKFIETSASEQDLPRTLQSQIYKKQRTMTEKLQDTSKINSALRTVGPMLGDAGIRPSRTDAVAQSDYNQFVGAFDVKLREFEEKNKKFPNEEEQRKLAAGLLTEKSEWSIFSPSTWFNDTDPRFKVPDSFKTEWGTKFKQRYGDDPTPSQMFEMYQRSLSRGK